MVALKRRIGSRGRLRLALTLVISLAWTLPRAQASPAKLQVYASLMGTIDYAQRVNSSMTSRNGDQTTSSSHDDLHTTHVIVNALYNDKGGYYASVTESISDHDGNLTTTRSKDSCKDVQYSTADKSGSNYTVTAKYTGHAWVRPYVMDTGRDFVHPHFQDPYQLQLGFILPQFRGEAHSERFDINNDPCVTAPPIHDVDTYTELEDHQPTGMWEGHPDKHPKSARTLTGKVITIDQVPDPEHGTATTTITWRLNYCEKQSASQPAGPWKC